MHAAAMAHADALMLIFAASAADAIREYAYF